MLPIRRICLYGGPGVSKSTTAAGLFYALKQESLESKVIVELVQEYVKNWAYQKREPTGTDQVYLFAKQLHKEEVLLRNGVDMVITDSPLAMSVCYAEKKASKTVATSLRAIATEFEGTYPGLHLFIVRGNRPYIDKGRYETLEQAKSMDKFIIHQIKDMPECVPHSRFAYIQTASAVTQALDILKVVLQGQTISSTFDPTNAPLLTETV